MPPVTATPAPGGRPAPALAWLRAQGVDVEALVPRPRRCGAPGRWVGSTDDLVVRVALDDAARHWLEPERLRTAWALEHDIPTPDLLHHCEDVLVTARCPADPHRAGSFVRGAVEAADAVEDAPPPPQVVAGHGQARPVVARSRGGRLGQGGARLGQRRRRG